MSRTGSWRLPLRLARREAARARGRSILVLVMIALPVLGVTAADIVIQTSDVSTVESLDRRLGSADALVTFQEGSGRVFQGVDPNTSGSDGNDVRTGLPDLAEVEEALGPGTRGITWDQDVVGVETDKGVTDTEVSELDLRDPLTDGLFDVTVGRVAESNDEIVINHELASRGLEVGDELTVDAGGTYTVVGVGDNASSRNYPMAVGLPGSLGLADDAVTASFLVGGGAVSWQQVRDLNAAGGLVLSRAVVLDPPPASEMPVEVGSSGLDDAMIAVVVLVVVMALIEVVLLAGPAFAVGARRQSRSLALMTATGGTPAQARRVVLASGVVLGGAGAVLGVVAGIVTAWVATPVVQHFSDTWLGPFDVPWLHLVGIAAFGMLSALLAAVVPAWIASRQDVVAVLAGRRGDRRPSLRSPLLGLVLLGVGIATAVAGTRQSLQGEFLIAVSAIFSVLGMVLLVPVVLVVLARLSARLPLVLRYAVRDAARHRTRTVPAVAAVAATVAGVVALGIANASDAAEAEATYTPQAPMGLGLVTAYGAGADRWPQLRAAVEQYAPDAEVTSVEAVPADTESGDYRDIGFRVPGHPMLLQSFSSTLGSSVAVDDEAVPPLMSGLDGADEERAAAALAAGRAVVFVTGALPDGDVRMVVQEYPADGSRADRRAASRVPATFIDVGAATASLQAVLPTAVVEEAGLEHQPMALTVAGGLTGQQEQDIEEAVAGVASSADLYVERGFQKDDAGVIILLVLGALGGLLVLGGTLTATFLALSDARPDLATLAAVGAAPRTRRGVASAYAVVVGLVGGVLGAAVGFIPGLAVTYPLTAMSGSTCVVDGSGACTSTGVGVGPYVDVPWLMIIGLVVVLPLLTAAVVGLTARSRLPLVSRLD